MKKSKESKLEGLHYEILQAFLENGDTKDIEDPEMVEYLEQLELIRGWHYSLKGEKQIVRALILKYKNLTPRTAKSRYVDSMNYHYADVTIKKTAYRNLYAESIERLARLITNSAVENKDYKLAGDLYHKAAIVRGSMEPDVDQLPDHIFTQRQPIVIMDPTMIGLPKADRNVLAKQIDAFDITESLKEKLLQEAGVKPFKIEERLDE